MQTVPSLRLLSALAIAATLAACSPKEEPAAAEKGQATPDAGPSVVLKVAHFLPANSNAHFNIIGPWCDILKEESAGRLICQIYPSLQLGGTAATLVDQVENGVADIVWTSPGYSAGRFPRVEAMELPFVMPYGAVIGNPLVWKFYEEYAKEDFKNYKVLALHGDGGQDIHVRSKPVTSLEDFRGLKLRSSSRTTAKTLEALGATPVSMPPAQMTESISKGVLDGALVSWEVVPPTKLDEVTQHHSNFAKGLPALGYTILSVLMNQQRYDALPDDLKAILDKHSGMALVERFGREWDKYTDAAKEAVPSDKHFAVDDAEYARWQDAVQSVAVDWVKDATERGLNGQELLDAARSLQQQQSPQSTQEGS